MVRARRSGDEDPATRQVPAVDLFDEPPDWFDETVEPTGPTPAVRRDPTAGRRGKVAGGTGPGGTGPGDKGPGDKGPGDKGPGGRIPLRYRILPRTLLGITALILSFAIGAGLSGAVLYSYYQYKLNQATDRVNALVNGYSQQFANAEGSLKATGAAASATIQSQLAPIQALEASPQLLAKLSRQLAPSVFFVHTLDANGQASVGSAFVVSSNANQSLLLTSYTTVAATTRAPAPDVFVRQGQTDTKVTVRAWDSTYDLALIVLPRGGLPVVTVASSAPAPQIGERVYAVSGLGSTGASVSQGAITDVSATGLQHEAGVGTAYQGGPLVNANGQVLAVASRTYAPVGFTTDSVWFAPYVQAACNKVLTCPGGMISGAQ